MGLLLFFLKVLYLAEAMDQLRHDSNSLVNNRRKEVKNRVLSLHTIVHILSYLRRPSVSLQENISLQNRNVKARMKMFR